MTFHSLHDETHLYFVTATVCGWKPIFAQDEYAFIVLDSLSWLRQNDRMFLHAFVLMPSHLHMIVKPRDHRIGDLLQDFGSFTAHTIVRVLKANGETALLNYFHEQRRDIRHQHSIWQDIQAKNIFSADFLREKIDYIHNNPIARQNKMVEDRADFKYSSACFYDRNQIPVIVVDDVREWL